MSVNFAGKAELFARHPRWKPRLPLEPFYLLLINPVILHKNTNLQWHHDLLKQRYSKFILKTLFFLYFMQTDQTGLYCYRQTFRTARVLFILYSFWQFLYKNETRKYVSLHLLCACISISFYVFISL